MMEEEMKLIATATATIGLALAAIPALAQTPEQRSVTFQTNDIDLATPKGQNELQWRIDRAVRHVCQTRTLATGSRIQPHDTKKCIARARNSAQQQVARIMAVDGQIGG
jgi:UrcA family protein